MGGNEWNREVAKLEFTGGFSLSMRRRSKRQAWFLPLSLFCLFSQAPKIFSGKFERSDILMVYPPCKPTLLAFM